MLAEVTWHFSFALSSAGFCILCQCSSGDFPRDFGHSFCNESFPKLSHCIMFLKCVAIPRLTMSRNRKSVQCGNICPTFVLQYYEHAFPTKHFEGIVSSQNVIMIVDFVHPNMITLFLLTHSSHQHDLVLPNNHVISFISRHVLLRRSALISSITMHTRGNKRNYRKTHFRVFSQYYARDLHAFVICSEVVFCW